MKRPFPIFKKRNQIILDRVHVVGFGTKKDLDLKIFEKEYGITCFNFEYLEMAQNYFKSIYVKEYDEEEILCHIPKTGGPVIFTYKAETFDKKPNQTVFFAVAPRIQEDTDE